MFTFFTDVKNRLTALEEHIKAIYAHLAATKETPVVVEAPKAEEPKDAA